MMFQWVICFFVGHAWAHTREAGRFVERGVGMRRWQGPQVRWVCKRCGETVLEYDRP